MDALLRRRFQSGLVLLVLCAARINGFGQDAGTAPVATSGSAGEYETQLLVLASGRVVSGNINPGGGGYTVEQPHGRMFIPYEQVRFEANSLDDAYHKMRKSVPVFTAGTHLILARWCISNKQFGSARHELIDALHLEPDREDIRDMLLRLDDLANPQPDTNDDNSHTSRLRSDGFQQQPAQSLGGLPREAAAGFATRIQPLLLNTCGNASCHGSDNDSGFRLTHRRGRSHRIVAERNLAEVLRLVDSQQPRHSRLLEILDGSHGDSGRPVFSGSAGARQIQILQDWVALCADPAADTRSSKTAVTRSRPRATNVASSPPLNSSTAPSGDTNNPPPGADNPIGEPVSSGTDPATAVVSQIRSDRVPDPFDPDEFNRLVHGITSIRSVPTNSFQPTNTR